MKRIKEKIKENEKLKKSESKQIGNFLISLLATCV